MPTTIKRITLWRKELPNQRGQLAQTLEPLAAAGANLRVVMAYAYPGEGGRAAAELWPVEGAQAQGAARGAGLAPASIPCLLIEGADQPGVGAKVARAVSGAGVNMDFVMALTAGGQYALIIGFANEADAAAAESALRPVASALDARAKPVKRTVRKRAAGKRSAKKAVKKAAKKKKRR